MTSRIGIALAVLAVLPPTTAFAQDAASKFRPVPSIGAGFATAQGTGAGPTLVGSLEFGGISGPLRLRLDGQVAQWQQPVATQRLGALTVNLVGELRPHGIRPFLMAGGGGYAGSGTGLRPGWSAGLGIVVPVGQRELVLESRYHEWHRPDVDGTARAARFVVPLALRLRF